MRLLVLCIFSFMPHVLSAKIAYREIHKVKEFDKRLQRYPFTIVLFVKGNHYDAINEFAFAADQQKYKDNDVQFLLVDISKKGLGVLKESYRIAIEPSILLFSNGSSIKNTQHTAVSLSQFTWQDIDDFINDYLGQAIQAYSEQKIEHRRACYENDLYYPSWRLGLPWYGPYWPPYGWDPYWYGSNWYGCPRGY